MRGREDALRALADMRPDLARVRENAFLACAASSTACISVQGVPVSAVLARVDEIAVLFAQAAAELRSEIGL
jgi:hypothetical protein